MAAPGTDGCVGPGRHSKRGASKVGAEQVLHSLTVGGGGGRFRGLGWRFGVAACNRRWQCSRGGHRKVWKSGRSLSGNLGRGIGGGRGCIMVSEEQLGMAALGPPCS
jgi:hypothetical protein